MPPKTRSQKQDDSFDRESKDEEQKGIDTIQEEGAGSAVAVPVNLLETILQRLNVIEGSVRTQAQGIVEQTQEEESVEDLEGMTNMESEISTAQSKNRLLQAIQEAVPKYDGEIDGKGLSEFLFKIEEFFSFEQSENLRIKFAASKFENGALLWWRTRKTKTPRIQTWDALKNELTNTFRSPSYIRKLEDKLYNIRQNGTVSEFVEKFTEIVVQLPDLPETTVVNAFLRGLHESIRSKITIFSGNLDTIQSTINASLAQEANDQANSSGVFYTGNRFAAYRCRECGELGHIRRMCKKRKNSDENNSNGAPRNVTFFLSTLVANMMMETKNGERTFILDSGSCCHISPFRSDFSTYSKEEKEICVANGQAVKTMGIGSIILQLGSTSITIRNVYHMPAITHRLLSVGLLVEYGTVCQMSSEGLSLSINGNVFYSAKKSNQMYLLSAPGPIKVFRISENNEEEQEDDGSDDGQENNNIEHNDSINTNPSYDLWHARLGHLSYERMKRLASIADGDVSKIVFPPEPFCVKCNNAKQKRMKFGRKNKKDFPLELVHLDIFGPLRTESFHKNKYILGLIDSHSGFVSLYYQATKSGTETAKNFQKYLAWAERQCNRKLLAIRADNGLEFINQEMFHTTDFFGIEIQTTCKYTPQQNGRIERFWSTLANGMRSILIDCHLPHEAWEDIATTVQTIENLVPKKGEIVNPANLFFGHKKKPCLEYMRRLGSIVTFKENIPTVGKLEQRSGTGILVGYDKQFRGYKIYQHDKQRIVVSRDVKFDESFERTGNISFLFEEDCVNLMNNEKDFVPRTPAEIENSVEYDEWMIAIQSEINSFEKRAVWEETTDLPQDCYPISAKWVFTIKEQLDGSKKKKARLVIRGFEENRLYDLNELYAPTLNKLSLRLFVNMIAKLNYVLGQCDVVTAYLNSVLEDPVYVIPPHFLPQSKIPGTYMKLKKSVYGLKQAPQNWFKCFIEKVSTIGFTPSNSEICMLSRQIQKTSDKEYIAIYVDDILIGASTELKVKEIKKNLSTLFELRDIVPVKSIIGVEIIDTADYIKLTQTKYVEEILVKRQLNECNPSKIPCDQESLDALCKLEKLNPPSYDLRQSIGEFLYLAGATRPDISYTISILSRYANKQSIELEGCIKKVYRYLRGTPNVGISYAKKTRKQPIRIWSDSNYGSNDNISAKATSGFIICDQGPIHWNSKLQTSVSLSTCDAEMIALQMALKSYLGVRNIYSEILNEPETANFYMDNNAGMILLKTGTATPRTRHLRIAFGFVKENIDEKIISLERVDTNSNASDIFTKILPIVKQKKFIDWLEKGEYETYDDFLTKTMN